jgi:MoaA/NifB/PqqE/SkfB family radical SAM enzyme
MNESTPLLKINVQTDGDATDSVLSPSKSERMTDAYKIKDKQPSATMHPTDGRRYTCHWINDSITIHSDGNVSCGLDDPYARRSFGNVYEQRLVDLYRNPEFDRLREKLWSGHR